MTKLYFIFMFCFCIELKAQTSPICFEPYQNAKNLLGFSGTSAALSADFNNDSIADIAMASSINPLITIFIGEGNNQYGPGINFFTLDIPLAMECTDFNNDGIKDIAVLCGQVNSRINIFKGNDTSFYKFFMYFTLASDLVLNHKATAMQSSDFNSDSIPDLVVSNISFNSKSIEFISGQGNTNFGLNSPINFPVAIEPKFIELGYFDSDSHEDLVISNYDSNKIVILSGNGQGSFAPTLSFPLSFTPLKLISCDFNNDSLSDLAITKSTGGVAILLSTNNTPLNTVFNYIAGVLPFNIKEADFNLDGINDLILSDYVSQKMIVLKGIGSGAFASGVDYLYSVSISNINAFDLNSDNRKDLILEGGINGVTILLNVPQNVISTVNDTICYGDSIMLTASNGYNHLWNNGDTLKSIIVSPNLTTTYSVVSSTMLGCFYTKMNIVTVNPALNTNTIKTNDTLQSLAFGVSYQWLNCISNTIISGATNQTYIPTTIGSYAVIISDGTCTDTSACINVTSVGFDKIIGNNFKIYPNPNNGAFTIESTKPNTVDVTNLLGEIVLKQTLKQGENVIDIKDQPNGFYLVKGEWINWKVVKQ